MTLCPNRFPSIDPGGFRLAIVGEAPGEHEISEGQPFVGTSGRFLSALLSRAGVTREMCFFGNICQYRPYNNEISAFRWDGPEIQEGLAQLTLDIRKFNPNIILCLGNTSLKAALDPLVAHPLKPGRFRFSVSDWRGSLLKSTHMQSPFFGRKLMCSYHPAYVLRDYSTAPVLQLDLKKAVREARSPDLYIPERRTKIPSSANEVVEWLTELTLNKRLCSIDIEGGINTMSCIGFATSSSEAFIVPFAKLDGSNYWSTVEEETTIWRALVDVLQDPKIPKVLQNSLYDRFILQHCYSVVVLGVQDDTMLRHWELYCELEKSLAFQASIYTNEPYWKHERLQDESY